MKHISLALLLGLGVGIFYLVGIMYHVTGRLPDVSAILNHLSGLEQIATALGG
jgi:hypothetical protein